jgi:glycosyltransferase involved in cell wall biosynthesis
MVTSRNPELVSVIMPVYGGERFVAAAIRSVLAQSYDRYELVIVNDGSPDGSAGEIARFLPHPKIRYTEQKNAGVANARNAGIAMSMGAAVALLDQDDLWLPDKLERQMAFLAERPDVGFVHSRVECIDGAGATRSCEGAIQVHPFAGRCAGALLAGNAIAPLTVVMRRACLDEVGVFDQQFAPADDWHLWLRIARIYPVGFLDRITAQYRFHGDNVSKDQLIMQRAILRVVDAVCERFPDIAQSTTPTELAAARSRMLKVTAEVLAARGQRGEANDYWKAAYKSNGDLEALLGLLAIPARLRKRFEALLTTMPRLDRRLRWYSYKAAMRYSSRTKR